MHFTGAKIFAIDTVVVNAQNCWRFFSQCNASSQRNNLIKITHYDETMKRANDSQIVRANKNLKLSYGGPSQGQASGTNQAYDDQH